MATAEAVVGQTQQNAGPIHETDSFGSERFAQLQAQLVDRWRSIDNFYRSPR